MVFQIRCLIENNFDIPPTSPQVEAANPHSALNSEVSYLMEGGSEGPKMIDTDYDKYDSVCDRIYLCRLHAKSLRG